MTARVAGIDIGSRTIKLVVSDESRIERQEVRPNSHDPIAVCRELLNGESYDRLVATGYGRHLFEQYYDCSVVTEIKAVSLGTRALFPEARTVLDIGGQDTKCISLDDAGRMTKFEMNDKCAAGTGKFLEVMATALGYTMGDFIGAARNAEQSRKINAMCTVFAESEVIGLVARETPRDELARGLHEAVANRAAAMAKRLSLKPDIVFCGGAAKNTCLVELLQERLGQPLSVADDTQIVAALGCTLVS